MTFKNIIFLSFSILLFSCYHPCELVQKQFKKEVSGKISKRFKRPSDPHVKMIQFPSSDKLNTELYLIDDDNDIWEKLNVGDSVYKPANSNKLIRFRKNEVDTLLIEFSFCKISR